MGRLEREVGAGGKLCGLESAPDEAAARHRQRDRATKAQDPRLETRQRLAQAMPRELGAPLADERLDHALELEDVTKCGIVLDGEHREAVGRTEMMHTPA